MDTIRWLSVDTRSTVQGWLNLVERIEQIQEKQPFAVTDPLRPKDALDRLMVGWTGWSDYSINQVTYCALKSFGKNVLKRLMGVPKVTTAKEQWKRRGMDVDYMLGMLNMENNHCAVKFVCLFVFIIP